MRWVGIPDHPFEYGFQLKYVPAMLERPFRWVKSQRVFVNSMSDLFHEEISKEYLDMVFKVFKRADWHTYQILTKRSDRMTRFMNQITDTETLDNIWLGVSVENFDCGITRVEDLRKIKNVKRFISFEPLLGDVSNLNLEGIDWAIVGGETGPRARKVNPDWVHGIIDRCKSDNIPVFFKQWGGLKRDRNEFLIDGKVVRDLPPNVSLKVPSRQERTRRLESFKIELNKLRLPSSMTI